MFGEKNVEDGTGRGGKKMKITVARMGRDGMVGVDFLDGTGGDGTLQWHFCFMTGRDGK